MSRVDGLAYGGNSLADKYAGTGVYARRPTVTERVEKTERERWAARADLTARLMAGELNGQVMTWNTRNLVRPVTVVRVKGGAIRIAYDGCTVDVSPYALELVA